MSPDKISLDDVVRDSKELLEPSLVGARVDWEKVESRLFARVAQVATEAKARPLARVAGGRGWAAAAAALALAAAVPMLVGRSSTIPLDDAVSQETRADRTAGALAWKEGAGEVRVGAPPVVAAAGSALMRGDGVETHEARAVFERTASGKTAVTWALEDASRATVKGTRGALVLALERGAVEAQVTPVPAGEAFAVDVDGTRVAVHGTHLRVSRDGTRVVVDLTEGVVSIGPPPRSGSTYGELVTAPAHIEFDANDPHGTLKVTHSPDRVRAALALRPPAEQVVTVTPRAGIGHDEPPRVAAAGAPRPSPVAGKPAASSPPAAPAPPQHAAPYAPTPLDPHPEQTIANAVRDCVRTDASAHPDDVLITVSSKLELRVNEDGSVASARFDPPLKPEVQTCASKAIYGARFSRAGAFAIPLDFQR